MIDEDRLKETESTHPQKLERRPAGRSSHSHTFHDEDLPPSRSSTPVRNGYSQQRPHSRSSRMPEKNGNPRLKNHVSSTISSSGEENGDYREQEQPPQPTSILSSESRRTLRAEWSAESVNRRPRSKSPVLPSPQSSPRRSKSSSPVPESSTIHGTRPLEFTFRHTSSQEASYRGHRDRSQTASPVSRTSNYGSFGRSSRTVDLTRNEASEAAPAPTSPGRKGHRRSTTELSEPMGAYPRVSSRRSSIDLPDTEDSDVSLFANESIPPPQTSTPPFHATEIPDFTISPAPSDIPLPESPSPPPTPRQGTIARANTDLARLQKAISPNFIFPPRRPSPPLSTTPLMNR